MTKKSEPVDKDKDIKVSVARIEELRKNRNEVDIPLDDEYWIALNKHRAAFSK